MSRTPVLALGLLAAALASGIAWELSDPAEQMSALPAVVDRVVSAGATTVALAGPAPAGVDVQILARPIFSPDRRPAAAVAGAAGSETPLPRLTGVLVTADGRSAVFAGGAQLLVVREGGQLGRYTIRKIEPGLVKIEGSDGFRVLRPTFDTERPTAAVGLSPSGSPQPRPPFSTLVPPAPNTVPSPSPRPPDGPRGSMTFDSNPAPSGQDILNNQATQMPAVGTPVSK